MQRIDIRTCLTRKNKKEKNTWEIIIKQVVEFFGLLE